MWLKFKKTGHSIRGIVHTNKEIPDKKVDLATKRKSLFSPNTVQQKITEKICA
jgi:hypothetical protein